MHRRLRSWLLRSRLLRLVPAIAVLAMVTGTAVAAPRLALVVGNAAYPARPLATAVNDAALVAQALAQAGFDVTAAHDLDRAGARAAFDSFADAARAAGPDATLFVYLSGYGVQYDGGNYLVPVDAKLDHDDDVPRETADLDDLIRTLASVPAKARVLVFDLARANPFATSDEMPLANGLAFRAAPKDTLIATNAAPGMTAPQDALPYGAYARALAEMIGTPGLSRDMLFERTRLRVGELTDGTEVPWDDGMVDAAPLLPAADDAPTSSASSIDALPVDALSPDIAYSTVVARDSLPAYAEFVRAFPDGPLGARVRTLLAVRREAMIWQATLRSEDPRAFWTYLRRYPRGPHRFDARRRLAALHAPLDPPPRFDIIALPDLPPPTAAELKLVAAPLETLRDLPPIPPPPSALLQPADADYYDGLPPPAPAPAGLLPIAAPLPRAAAPADDGQITQMRPGSGAAVTQTAFGSADEATLTLTDADDEIAKVATSTPKDGTRIILESDPKGAVLSRTTIVHTVDGSTSVQTGAAGGVLYAIATRIDPDGARVTRVTNGREKLLASWRRNTDGIVVAREIPGAASPSAKSRLVTVAPTFLVFPPSPAIPAPPPAPASTPGDGRPATPFPPVTPLPPTTSEKSALPAVAAPLAAPAAPSPAIGAPSLPATFARPAVAPPVAAPPSLTPSSARASETASRREPPPLPPRRPGAEKTKAGEKTKAAGTKAVGTTKAAGKTKEKETAKAKEKTKAAGKTKTPPRKPAPHAAKLPKGAAHRPNKKR